MPTINGKACVINGTPVDKVFSNGNQVYGRNLVIGTSNELKTITTSSWGNSPTYRPRGAYGAGTYYASAYIENTTPVDMGVWARVSGRGYNVIGNTIPAGESGISSITFDIIEGDSVYGVWVGFSRLQTESYTYKYKEVMIKHTPSPWTPAPEDVM